jgi:hypothetical protein
MRFKANYHPFVSLEKNGAKLPCVFTTSFELVPLGIIIQIEILHLALEISIGKS